MDGKQDGHDRKQYTTQCSIETHRSLVPVPVRVLVPVSMSHNTFYASVFVDEIKMYNRQLSKNFIANMH